MSIRRVSSVMDVRTKLQFLTTGASSEIADLLYGVFQYRLIRWIKGKGHPIKLRGTYILESVFDAECGDALVRARLLLRAVSDSELLPSNPSVRLQVSFCHLLVSK
jgi:hypothetical protein